MTNIFKSEGKSTEALRSLLNMFPKPFSLGDRVGIKLHWGERGNENFIRPLYAREIVRWLKEGGAKPYIFDTTVLYSGGRRDGTESLKTAAEHGFTEEYLECSVLIGDGLDGRDVMDIPSAGKHFDTVQVAGIIKETDGFVIFSHFKGHMEASFGGSIKNISMGMASRAQKQRMHSDVHPVLIQKRCIRCGICQEVCPVGAAVLPPDDQYPLYDLDKCVGCAQCIALCPQAALKIFWETDISVFQEKIVETAASTWKLIGPKSIVINALIQIVTECDCLEGKHPPLAGDFGFIGGYNPVAVDEESIKMIGPDKFDAAHPGIPWQLQFSYARETGFAK
ncbi:MAG: hypothetical protein A3J94_11190 [Syntrophus sp. RIFOXYC2_FULL_54_9]|nr:MAG: hypothetical protein A3J94_11190 [Syntrophus sp. RIFOXYC2_FULL_54_9]